MNAMGTTEARSTTSTARLEVLLNLPPLHLTVKKEAREATHLYLTNSIMVNGDSQKTLEKLPSGYC